MSGHLLKIIFSIINSTEIYLNIYYVPHYKINTCILGLELKEKV